MPLCCVGNPVSQPGKPLHLCFQEFKNSWHPPCTWRGQRGSPSGEDGHIGANPPPQCERLWSVLSLGMSVARVRVGSWPERGQWRWGWRGPGSLSPSLTVGLGKPALVTQAWAWGAWGLQQGLPRRACDLLHPPAGRARGEPGLRWILVLSSQSCTKVPVAAAHLTLNKNCPQTPTCPGDEFCPYEGSTWMLCTGSQCRAQSASCSLGDVPLQLGSACPWPNEGLSWASLVPCRVLWYGLAWVW